MTEKISEIEKLFNENELNSEVILQKAISLGTDFLGWMNVRPSEVNVRRVTGGQSNHMFHVTSSVSGASEFLVRIHRQSPSHVFRDTINFCIFSERGLGPKLLGFFEGGRLEEFLPSKTMDYSSVLKPEISRKVGAVFPKYHAIEVPVSKNRRCIQIMKEWILEYQRLGCGDYEVRPRTLTYTDHPKSISVAEIIEEMENFEKMAKELFEETVVFSHNDLACGNILQLDSTGEIVLIDWEFATYNWRGFDLAMFLAETAIDYSVPFPPGVKFLQEITDNHPNVRIFCEAYVDSDNRLKSLTPSSESRESQISSLIQEVEFFWPLTHLFWTCQSLMYKALNYDNGVDMDVASSDRLAVYFHLKPRSLRIYEEIKNKK